MWLAVPERRRTPKPRHGECWKVEASAAGRPEIFVSPMLADSVEVGAVLVHEVIHAALPDAGHPPG